MTPIILNEDAVALRAYFKWEQRGCPIGDAQRDWFEAREELQRENERSEQPDPKN